MSKKGCNQEFEGELLYFKQFDSNSSKCKCCNIAVECYEASQ